MDLPDAPNGIDVSSAYDDLETRFRRFEEVVIPMFMQGGPRFSSKGDMIVTFTVPFKYRHTAMPLLDAMGLPLQVQMRRWTGD